MKKTILLATFATLAMVFAGLLTPVAAQSNKEIYVNTTDGLKREVHLTVSGTQVGIESFTTNLQTNVRTKFDLTVIHADLNHTDDYPYVRVRFTKSGEVHEMHFQGDKLIRVSPKGEKLIFFRQ